jgi:hypothetical protein
MISQTETLTPNVKRLLVEFIAKRQIDRARQDAAKGEHGLAASVVSHLIADGAKILSNDALMALADVNNAIAAVRNAIDPNPFRDLSDEEIATEIMTRIKARRRAA